MTVEQYEIVSQQRMRRRIAEEAMQQKADELEEAKAAGFDKVRDWEDYRIKQLRNGKSVPARKHSNMREQMVRQQLGLEPTPVPPETRPDRGFTII